MKRYKMQDDVRVMATFTVRGPKKYDIMEKMFEAVGRIDGVVDFTVNECGVGSLLHDTVVEPMR